MGFFTFLVSIFSWLGKPFSASWTIAGNKGQAGRIKLGLSATRNTCRKIALGATLGGGNGMQFACEAEIQRDAANAADALGRKIFRWQPLRF